MYKELTILGVISFTLFILEEEHVVNIGKVQDSSSRKALPAADYAALREANVLDEILWHWARRAFLESLHCAP